MKKLISKTHITSICLIFLLSFFFTSCNSVNPDEINSGILSVQADESVYLDSLPSDVYLYLGKSLLIENGNTVFRFIEVLENNENNSAVSLQIDYDNGVSKTIVLNTVNIPRSYHLENGYYHVIYLKEVHTDRIMFTYNEYGRG